MTVLKFPSTIINLIARVNRTQIATVRQIEMTPLKTRANDFYSRVAMHQKNDRVSAAEE